MKNVKDILKKLRNPKVIKAIALFVICALLFAGTLFYFKKESRLFIENSLVDAQIIPIAPQTPGKLKDIFVIEGEKVNKGDALAEVGSEILRSYTDGIITTTSKQFGALVSAQNPPIQMINYYDMRISGTIDENKGLNQIKVGQVVSFTVDALPGKTFWGYVDEVSPAAKQTQLAFSISSERPTQQFLVFAKFNATAYPEIKTGMSSKMTVYTK